MVHFSSIDIILILFYFGLVLYAGLKALKKQKSSTDDFLLAGRTLTLPMFVATLVSTWYGGILGVGEYSYKYGISNWVVMGVPYYFFALIFALFLAKKARETNLTTIPDQLFKAYDKKTSILSAILTFILVTPAPYVLMLGILIQIIFGINLALSIILSTFVTICYLWFGGFRSDVYANIVEFVLMFLGFAVIIPFAYSRFGGLEYLQAQLPPLHLTGHGGNSLQFIFVWFFIAMWTLVDPAFYQRCYAARDAKTARNGIIISMLFWLLFDFMTSTAGLYARAALPSLEQPTFAYPMLAEMILPSVWKGLFYIGMLATIMSTLSSLTFIGASTIGNDIVGRLLSTVDPAEKESAIRRWTKTGLIISGLTAILLALGIPSVVRLWYVIGTAIIPGLIVPLMASYFPPLSIPKQYAFFSMLFGWGTSTVWLITGQLNGGNYWFTIEPMYPGLGMAILIWGLGKIHR
jgi:SSS family solute:Na+ symporter